MPVLWITFALFILLQSLMSFSNGYSSGFYTQIHSPDPDMLSLLDLLSLNPLTGSGHNINHKIKFIVQYKYAQFFTTQTSSV